MTYTLIAPGVDQESLYKCARGCYQVALLNGRQAWSGATLRGRAKSYGIHYARSRRNLINRITKLGVKVDWAVGKYGKRVLVVGKVYELDNSVTNNLMIRSVLT